MQDRRVQVGKIIESVDGWIEVILVYTFAYETKLFVLDFDLNL